MIDITLYKHNDHWYATTSAGHVYVVQAYYRETLPNIVQRVAEPIHTPSAHLRVIYKHAGVLYSFNTLSGNRRYYYPCGVGRNYSPDVTNTPARKQRIEPDRTGKYSPTRTNFAEFHRIREWWNTYNAVLAALILRNKRQDGYPGAELRRQARRMANATHGKIGSTS